MQIQPMSESVHVKSVCSTVALALVGTLVLGFASATRTSATRTDAARTEAETLSGTARVLDGDTLEISGVRVRLEGIDAPEHGQSCGQRGGGSWACGAAAASALERMIGRQTVDCSPSGQDKYGRTLGFCRAGTLDLNAEMVRKGFAWAFVKYSKVYVAAEAAARAASIGVWQGAADPPWVFRESRWMSAAPAAPKGCAIKGNVSAKGNIYHMPWSPWYGRVKVDTVRGERWFCTEADALAAGWRPAIAQ